MISSIDSVTSYFSMVGLILGLICIGLGRGGMEVVTPVFMMDQLLGHDPDEDAVASFFRTYEWTLYAGRFFGILLSCLTKVVNQYWIIFCLHCSVILIAMIFFFVFRNKFTQMEPNKFNIFLEYYRIVRDAIKNKIYANNLDLNSINSWAIKPEHWLDWAKVDHTIEHVDGLMSIFTLFVVFSPFSIFWALQSLSTFVWIDQAKETSRSLGHITFTPTQTQLTRYSLGMIFIPFVNFGVFPLLRRTKQMVRPITRIIIGLLFTIIGTLTAIMLQLEINNSPQQSVSMFWQVPQYWLICLSDLFVHSTGLELIFTETPEKVKSTMVGFFTIVYAIGFLGVVIFQYTHDKNKNVVVLYAIVASLLSLFTGFFAFFMRNFRYQCDLEMSVPKVTITSTNILSESTDDDFGGGKDGSGSGGSGRGITALSSSSANTTISDQEFVLPCLSNNRHVHSMLTESDAEESSK
eukprot:TRINITY_DN5566_c0_g1_i1.p1 TRINITY_DN5566_c0_g1~~TRINITY_DN5566_c0_g1_i1.p1  ORF type:complete len:464 (+),score=63.14 TRINITY_DN5566_c0_g1_i1:1508-2899(+)